MRSYWIKVSPQFNNWYLYKRKEGRIGYRDIDTKETQGRRPCDDGNRDLNDGAVRQRTPRISGNHQKQGRIKEAFFSRAFRESTALPTP